MKSLFTALLLTLTVFTSQANEVSKISQQQLLSMQNAPTAPDFIILDVRSEEEFKAGHIKGAMNISHDTIEQHLNKLSDYKNKTVVVHCRSGRRAQTAEAALQAHGFKKLRHLDGDYNAWLAAELPLVKE
ncbi:rhodanese-like domain-containing protein [Colwelliaceae bacterium 6441]